MPQGSGRGLTRLFSLWPSLVGGSRSGSNFAVLWGSGAKGKSQRLRNIPPALGRRVRGSGAKLGMEAGFIQAGGWGLDQSEEGAAELEPGP